jgi:hypothetical protein
MKIRYSPPRELEVEGSPSELQGIRSLLLNPKSVEEGFVVEADTSFDPAPYQNCLERIVVKIGTEPILIKVDSGSLMVTGSLKDMERFASYFDAPEDPASGWHQHHEYFEGNNYIAPDSVPVVISTEMPA